MPYGRKGKKVKELPKDLLPREKLERLGADRLSEAELWAVILGSGTKGFSVLEIGEALAELGLERLLEMAPEEIAKIRGVGRAKALVVKAVAELCRRFKEGSEEIFIKSPADAVKVVSPLIKGKKEHLFVLSLSIGQKLLDVELVALGSLNTVGAPLREIFLPVVRSGGYFFILLHNHPDGKSLPSEEDKAFTRRVKETGKLLGLELLDHIVLGEDGFYSFRENGLLE